MKRRKKTFYFSLTNILPCPSVILYNTYINIYYFTFTNRQRKRDLPESVVCHDGGERADVDAPDDPVVEECERKVEDEGAPDRDVVPHRPVLGVQRNL